jgi:hypothetical protein
VVEIRKMVQGYQWDSAHEEEEATEIAKDIIALWATRKPRSGGS